MSDAPISVEDFEVWLYQQAEDARHLAWRASLFDDYTAEASWTKAAEAYDHARENTLYISSVGFGVDIYEHCDGCDNEFCDGVGV